MRDSRLSSNPGEGSNSQSSQRRDVKHRSETSPSPPKSLDFIKKHAEQEQSLKNDPLRKMKEYLDKLHDIYDLDNQLSIIRENIKIKLQQEGSLAKEFCDQFKDKLDSLFENFKASYVSITEDDPKNLSFQEQDKARITDHQIKVLKEDLEKWCHIHENCLKIKKAFRNYAREEHRPLMRALTHKAIVTAKEAYEQILEGYQQESDQPNARRRFEDVCNWFKERPAKLVEMYNDQSLYFLEEGDHTTKQWSEHTESIFASLGMKETFISNENLAETAKEYRATVAPLQYEYRIFNNIDTYKDFLSREEAFEHHLQKEGWLSEDPVSEKFDWTFETTIEEDTANKGIFTLTSKDIIGRGYYGNKIDVNEGQIIGGGNYKRSTKNWHLSEVMYAQLQLALKKAGKDLSQFDLKSWYGMNVTNEETKLVAERFLPQEETERAFEAGSAEFAALAQTPTAKSKFYLLAQHPEAFGGKEVTSITVKRVFERGGHKLREPQIDIVYAIGDIKSEPTLGSR
jgi:hypothetical protein